MYQGEFFKIDNFAGGYCGNLPITQLGLNQAADVDNMIVLPGGKGIRTRRGNAALNASALNSGANIQGFGHLLQADQDDWFVAIAGAKIYQSANLTFSDATDITNTLTITAGADNQWNLFGFNDSIIGFGGSPTSPDAPLRWTGSGNAAALTGSPPSAYGGFAANNRVFGYRTSSNPSTIYWSIIGDAQDWTGSGSGSAVAGSLSDGQRITGAIVISTNYVLVFKENSTYQMVISSAPFPIYSLFDNVGAVGKNAIVNVDGRVFFINSLGEMVSTDGESLKTYPSSADDLWSAVQPSRYQYICGFREKTTDHDWLVWCVSTTGSTNNTSIIWDLENECWLKCSTGYKMNIAGKDDKGNVYMGGYDGFIYKPDQSSDYADASESGGGTITAFWRSGWMNPSAVSKVVQVRKIVANYKTKASGNITINYGFDFTADTASFTVSQIPTASETYTSRGGMLTGRGNFFQFKVGQSSSTIDSEIHSLLLHGKTYGQKNIDAD